MAYEDYILPNAEVNAAPLKKIYIEAQKELATPSPAVRLGSYPKLNQMTGGFRSNEFSILCGATGVGKTTIVANLSRDMIDSKVPHFVASVETGHTDFVKRIISAKRGKDWNTGDPVDVGTLKEFHVNHGSTFNTDNMWLSLYDNRFSVTTLMSDIAYMVKTHGIKLAIIDNLNFFLEVTSQENAVMEMDRVIHSLIIFCKRIPIHIIMVMHPKKTDNGRVESEFDIKGSSTAVQEAHNIFLLNRPHIDLIRNNLARPQDREIMIAKMRRRGKFVRKKLIIKSDDCVSYYEGDIVNE